MQSNCASDILSCMHRCTAGLSVQEYLWPLAINTHISQTGISVHEEEQTECTLNSSALYQRMQTMSGHTVRSDIHTISNAL